jgi:hypothetical protein
MKKRSAQAKKPQLKVKDLKPKKGVKGGRRPTNTYGAGPQ